MYCQQCGQQIGEEARFCQFCGQPVPGLAAAQVPAAAPAPASAAPELVYAGFWLRFLAYLIDYVVVVIALFLLALLVAVLLAVFLGVSGDAASMSERDWGGMGEAVGTLLFLPGWLLYYALLESSPWQATLGKRALGLVVTTLEGEPVSLGRALGRNLGKILSSLILMIGFLLAGFTEKKQALHDLLADCLVVKKA